MHGPLRNFWVARCLVWGAADIRDCNQTLFIPHYSDSSASSYSPCRISLVYISTRAFKYFYSIFYTHKTCVNCNYFLAFPQISTQKSITKWFSLLHRSIPLVSQPRFKITVRLSEASRWLKRSNQYTLQAALAFNSPSIPFTASTLPLHPPHPLSEQLTNPALRQTGTISVSKSAK